MPWFRREKKPLLPLPESSHIRTEGLWIKCEGCSQIIWKKDLETHWNVCPKCGYHFRLDARARLLLLLDEAQYTEHDAALESNDPLHFVDLKPYKERLLSAQKATGLKDAIITAEGRMGGKTVLVCAMEYAFIGGSMGGVVGEKITRAL